MRTLLVLVALLTFGCKKQSRPRIAPMSELASMCSAGDFGCPVPILYVHDLENSQSYFRDQLGFTLDWTDQGDFASVHRGHTYLFLCQRCQGNAGSWVWVATPDVDKTYKDLAQRGARIKAKPEDQRWGVREMQVEDLDGNVLRVGSPIEHE